MNHSINIQPAPSQKPPKSVEALRLAPTAVDQIRVVLGDKIISISKCDVLELHGFDPEEEWENLIQTWVNAFKSNPGYRFIVVPGKGIHSKNQYSALRSHVEKFLNKLQDHGEITFKRIIDSDNNYGSFLVTIAPFAQLKRAA